MSGKTIAALTVTAAAIGVGIWWLRKRDSSAANVSLIQAAQQASQQAAASAATRAVTTGASSFGAAAPLTAAQAAEMRANPEARSGAAHFN